MKRFHAMIWLGVVLVAAGGYRLIAPFSTTIGTVRTSCGNAVADLDGQDKQAAFTSTLSVCQSLLRQATLEGVIGALVGLVLFIVGLVIVRRRGRVVRAIRRPSRVERSTGAGAPTAGTATVGTAAAAMSNAEVYEQFMRLGRLTRPKSVLSFFAVLFAAIIAGSVVAISLFLKNAQLSHYIGWILAFDALIAIALIVGVFVTITKDPAKLMLSEIANQNSVALTRGRRRDDPPIDAPIVRRVTQDGDQQEVAQFRRRWDDQR